MSVCNVFSKAHSGPNALHNMAYGPKNHKVALGFGGQMEIMAQIWPGILAGLLSVLASGFSKEFPVVPQCGHPIRNPYKPMVTPLQSIYRRFQCPW